MKSHIQQSQQGFGLLEVLVAVLITTIGLLGIAKLQIYNNQSVTASYMDVQAIGHIEEMIARLRSNKQAAIKGDYNAGNTSTMVTFSSLSAPTDSSSQPVKGFYNWMKSLSNTIPAAESIINCNNTGLCAVSVRYKGIKAAQKQTLVVYL